MAQLAPVESVIQRKLRIIGSYYVYCYIVRAHQDSTSVKLNSAFSYSRKPGEFFMSRVSVFALATITAVLACSPADQADQVAQAAPEEPGRGMASIADDTSQPNIVNVAVGSPDHTTLVAAVQAADLVDVLANPGPFTVFAPTNAAFDKLPAGTVDDLLKPENKSTLRKILHHHVTTSALAIDHFRDGQSLWLVDGGHETITMKDGEMWIGEAKVIGSVRASNGWVHVIDGVLVPGEE